MRCKSEFINWVAKRGPWCGCVLLVLLLAACAPSRVSTQTKFQEPPPSQPSGSAQRQSKQAPPLQELVGAKADVEPMPFEGKGWRDLFGGKLEGWQGIAFAGAGEVETIRELLLLNMGDPFTGVRYTNDFPILDYEIAFDAMRVMGSDFFCGLTIPVEESHCSLILGGWGGSLVGISSINGMDASENETTKFVGFDKGRWYRVRLRVTKDRIEAWLDQDKIVDVVTKDRQISVRGGEIEMCQPLGLASYQTTGAFRLIKWRPVDGPADPPPKRLRQ